MNIAHAVDMYTRVVVSVTGYTCRRRGALICTVASLHWTLMKVLKELYHSIIHTVSGVSL